jgi:hypothetical protein
MLSNLLVLTTCFQVENTTLAQWQDGGPKYCTKHFPVLQDRVNTMGPQSQHRHSPIKNCKVQMISRLSRGTTNKKQQMTLCGGIELRVDAGTLKCKKCERGAKYNKAHHPTCKQSNAYKFKLKTGRTTKLVSDERRPNQSVHKSRR